MHYESDQEQNMPTAEEDQKDNSREFVAAVLACSEY